jgi:hypothetical protein
MLRGDDLRGVSVKKWCDEVKRVPCPDLREQEEQEEEEQEEQEEEEEEQDT